MGGFICDHCQWTGPEENLFPHPREEYGLCPDCWKDGFEARARVKLGSLYEAMIDVEKYPRLPKACIDYTDEEWEIAARIAHFKAAHESAPVLLEAGIEGARQGGFDFMREEFRVQSTIPRRRKP
jgi:hypothetical protein